MLRDFEREIFVCPRNSLGHGDGGIFKTLNPITFGHNLTLVCLMSRKLSQQSCDDTERNSLDDCVLTELVRGGSSPQSGGREVTGSR